MFKKLVCQWVNNCRYALHVLSASCAHHQENYKLQMQPLVLVVSWDGVNPV